MDVTSYFTNINTSATGILTITPQPLSIFADNATKVYDGSALTKNSYTLSGLVPGETLTSVTITGSQTVAGTSDNVPSNAVIQKQQFNNSTIQQSTNNYDISYLNGSLTVLPKPLSITAASDTIVYNGFWLKNNNFSHSPLAPGDSIFSVSFSDSILYGECNNVPSNAVIKNVNCQLSTVNYDVSSSYNISYINGNLKVKQKKLTISSADSSKVYDGTVLTCHSFSDTGLVRNDYISYVYMPSLLYYSLYFS